MHRPLIIAHRGDPSRALENSLEAFRLALSVPVDMIELDIRKSRDNELYVMHDERTGRTCASDIHLDRSLSDDIAQVRLRNGESVPGLDDVLALVAGKAALNLEIKSEGAGALTAARLVGSGYRGAVLISSFKEREVLDAKRIAPAIPVAGIFDVFSPADVRAYRSRGYGIISLDRRTVTPDLIVALHEQSIKVYVWTVDEEEDMKQLAGWGVDGMYSNRPGLLLSAVDSL
jgi:glycerophosphoryl diester phosphodiesterase